MPRPQKDPLRPLTAEEQAALERLSRAQTESAAHVARAKALLAVAVSHSFTDAARAAGRKSGDAVAHLVARFNREGLTTLIPGHGGGQPKRYTPAGAGTDSARGAACARPGCRSDGDVVADDAPTGVAAGPGWLADGEHRDDLDRPARRGLPLAAGSQLVRDGCGRAQTEERRGDGRRSR